MPVDLPFPEHRQPQPYRRQQTWNTKSTRYSLAVGHRGRGVLSVMVLKRSKAAESRQTSEIGPGAQRRTSSRVEAMLGPRKQSFLHKLNEAWSRRISIISPISPTPSQADILNIQLHP